MGKNHEDTTTSLPLRQQQKEETCEKHREVRKEFSLIPTESSDYWQTYLRDQYGQ